MFKVVSRSFLVAAIISFLLAGGAGIGCADGGRLPKPLGPATCSSGLCELPGRSGGGGSEAASGLSGDMSSSDAGSSSWPS